jgi:hypothetical protein
LVYDFKYRDPEARQLVAELHARLQGLPASAARPLQHVSSATNSNAGVVTPRTGRVRQFTALDAPNTSLFPSALDATGSHKKKADPNAVASLKGISGIMNFRTGIAAFSHQAPHSLVVYAVVNWQCNFDGSVVFKTQGPLPNVPEWQKNGQFGTSTDPSFNILPTGLDANAANFEIWPPNFIAAAKSSTASRKRSTSRSCGTSLRSIMALMSSRSLTRKGFSLLTTTSTTSRTWTSK